MEISRINRALKAYKAVKYCSLVVHNGYVFITTLLFFFLWAPHAGLFSVTAMELGNVFCCLCAHLSDARHIDGLACRDKNITALKYKILTYLLIIFMDGDPLIVV